MHTPNAGRLNATPPSWLPCRMQLLTVRFVVVPLFAGERRPLRPLSASVQFEICDPDLSDVK